MLLRISEALDVPMGRWFEGVPTQQCRISAPASSLLAKLHTRVETMTNTDRRILLRLLDEPMGLERVAAFVALIGEMPELTQDRVLAVLQVGCTEPIAAE